MFISVSVGVLVGAETLACGGGEGIEQQHPNSKYTGVE